ncbi:MAG: hypothetical protein HC880_17350 [Bacteroidia bacterium]|nr:hypothetical protein [Bacteroidia bacterium]
MNAKSRDPERTPMQWNAGPYAGFSTVKPWLPLADNYQTRNVEAQQADPQSMLNLHRRLVYLRQTEDALHYGHYIPVSLREGVMAYRRASENACFLVLVNLSNQDTVFDEPRHHLRGKIILSTHLEDENQVFEEKFAMKANQGIIVRLD